MEKPARQAAAARPTAMWFADPGRPEQSLVGLRLDERQGGQVADLAGVEVGLEGGVASSSV